MQSVLGNLSSRTKSCVVCFCFFHWSPEELDFDRLSFGREGDNQEALTVLRGRPSTVITHHEPVVGLFKKQIFPEKRQEKMVFSL